MKYWLHRNRSLWDWIVWEVMRYVVRKRIQQTKRRLAAAGVVALVLAIGILAARQRQE